MGEALSNSPNRFDAHPYCGLPPLILPPDWMCPHTRKYLDNQTQYHGNPKKYKLRANLNKNADSETAKGYP